MKFIWSFFATVVFILLLLLVYYVHVSYFHVNIVFYAAVFDAVIAALLTCLLLFSLKRFNIFNRFEKFQFFVIWLLIGYTFAITVPTIIDRSLSFYILEKLVQRGGGIKQDRFEEVFTKEYATEHRLVDVRLTEQLQSGTIIIADGCVLVTEKGRFLASFSRYFRQNWLPKERLLMGQYTDDLTNPFKHSTQTVDYACSGIGP